MQGLLFSILASSMLSGGIHSTKPSNHPLPQACPSVNAIAAEGLDHVQLGQMAPPNYLWVGVKENSKYDTADNWTVMLNDVGGKNGKEEITQMAAKINSMQLSSGPEWYDDYEMSVCIYEIPRSPGKDPSFGWMIAYTPASYF